MGLTTQTTCPAPRANKVLLVRQLALQYPKSSLNNGPLLLYLTARDKERGEEALEKIHKDDQLKRASALQQYGGPTEVRYHQLDISQTNSIRMFSDFLKKEHPEGIDIVINNAGIAMDGFSQSSLHSNQRTSITPERCRHTAPHAQTPTSSKKPSSATTTAPSKRPKPSSLSSSPAAGVSSTSPAWPATSTNTAPASAPDSSPPRRSPQSLP